MPIMDEEKMRLLLKGGALVYIATVDGKGIPNVSPRFVLGLVGDDELLFADAYKNKTLSNIRQWPNVTIVVIDHSTLKGYQFKGKAKLVNDRETFDRASAKLKDFGFKLDPLKVWTVKVESAFAVAPAPVPKTPERGPYG